MRLKFAKKFTKQYDKGDQKIKSAVDQRIKLFLQDPLNTRLNNHALTGQFLGYRSINITGDWRAIFSEIPTSEGDRLVTFELLGTHSQLYN